MKKDLILERIEQLSTLCEETEPTSKELMYMDKLFTQDLIDVDNMYLTVKNKNYSRDEIIDIMKECNWIWKRRLKIKEIGWDKYNSIDRMIEESLRGGRKIEAIKTYRRHKIENDGDCSLKEAKEYIDRLVIKMGLDV
tara:strand:- start:96 stop:509 length:414 start_codon:yes stop_codon:yes gene_type:complete